MCKYGPLLLVLILLFGAPAEAQRLRHDSNYVQQHYPIANCKVKLANINSPHMATAQQILADPRLTPDDPNCRVVSFDFSMPQKGKDIVGPFTAKDDFLTMEMKEVVKQFNANSRIFIERIKLLCNGDTFFATPVLIYGK